MKPEGRSADEELFWNGLQPGAIVRLLEAKSATKRPPRLGIVARAVPGAGDLLVYPYDPTTGKLEMLASAVPKAVRVPCADVELFHSDRRAAVRHPGECTLYLDREAGVPIAAKIHDLSLDGVGFTVGRKLQPRQQIRLGFFGAGSPKGLVIGATVQSVRPVGESRWRAGCKFERRISPEELASFVP